MYDGSYIIDKDEERTEKVLKAIKDSTDTVKSSETYIIGSMKLKFDRIMGSLKLIFIVLTFSQFINTILLLFLCYHFGIIG